MGRVNRRPRDPRIRLSEGDTLPDMMKSLRYLPFLVLCVALLANGPAVAHDAYEPLVNHAVYREEGVALWVNVTFWLYEYAQDSSLGATHPISGTPHVYMKSFGPEGDVEEGVFSGSAYRMSPITDEFGTTMLWYLNTSVPEFEYSRIQYVIGYNYTNGGFGGTNHYHTFQDYISAQVLYEGTTIINVYSDGNTTHEEPTPPDYSDIYNFTNATFETQAHANTTWESQEHANATWCPQVDCVTTVSGESFVTEAEGNAWYEGQAHANATWESQEHANATWCARVLAECSGSFWGDFWGNFTGNYSGTTVYDPVWDNASHLLLMEAGDLNQPTLGESRDYAQEEGWLIQGAITLGSGINDNDASYQYGSGNLFTDDCVIGSGVTSFTVAGWVDGVEVAAHHQRVFNTSVSDPFTLSVLSGTRTVHVVLEGQSGSLATLPDNGAHHLAVAWSQGNASLYVDGIWKGSLSSVGTLNNDGKCWIGGTTPTRSEFRMAQWHVWGGTRLSDSQILSLATSDARSSENVATVTTEMRGGSYNGTHLGTFPDITAEVPEDVVTEDELSSEIGLFTHETDARQAVPYLAIAALVLLVLGITVWANAPWLSILGLAISVGGFFLALENSTEAGSFNPYIRMLFVGLAFLCFIAGGAAYARTNT